MSRYTKRIIVTEEIKKDLSDLNVELEVGKYELAYGYDHAVFYFYQFFNESGEVVCEEDTLFDKLHNSKIGNILYLFNCPQAVSCFLDVGF